ncbi:MAG: lysophospholipid acyltransferase family protein [Candidatus Schekmanbacteria bacterium]|nr:lysophospholipid acyltransferase family protein [Candidatus Schekmanbacteria bacterium]
MSGIAENIKRILKLFFLYTVGNIFKLFPYNLSCLLGDITGSLSFAIEKHKRGIVEAELRALLGRRLDGKDIDIIVRDCFRNFRKNAFDIWQFSRMNKERVRRISEIEGKENLDNALKNGKGVMICLSHFGSYKMILPVLGFEGYPVNQVAIRPTSFVKDGWSNAVDNRIMEMEYESEKKLPVKFLYIDRFLKSIFEALKKNEIVVMSMDGVAGARRTRVDLLDRKVLLSTGAIEIAMKTGASLVPAFMVRGSDKRHRIILGEPIGIDNEIPKDDAILKATQSFAGILASYIEKYPSHYGMFLYVARKNPVQGNQHIFQDV